MKLLFQDLPIIQFFTYSRIASQFLYFTVLHRSIVWC